MSCHQMWAEQRLHLKEATLFVTRGVHLTLSKTMHLCHTEESSGTSAKPTITYLLNWWLFSKFFMGGGRNSGWTRTIPQSEHTQVCQVMGLNQNNWLRTNWIWKGNAQDFCRIEIPPWGTVTVFLESWELARKL